MYEIKNGKSRGCDKKQPHYTTFSGINYTALILTDSFILCIGPVRLFFSGAPALIT